MTSIFPPALLASPNAWLLKPIFSDVHVKHQHCPIVIVGRPGCGKSYLALYFAELFDPTFNPVEDVVFNAGDFASKVNEKLAKGKCIIIDDAGLTAASTDAMTKEVKAISKTMQSIRSRNLVIILTIPNFFLLAKNVRTLLEYYMEPVRINRERNICHAKFRILKINPLTGDVYRYSPTLLKKVEHWTGYKHIQKAKAITLAFPKATDQTCRTYENLKASKMQEFNEKQAHQLNFNKVEDRQKRTKEIADFLQTKDARKYVSEDNEFNLALMASDFLVTKAIIKDALEQAGFKAIKKKGLHKQVFDYVPEISEKPKVSIQSMEAQLRELNTGTMVEALHPK